MFYWYFDPTYVLILIGMVLSLLASWRVNSTFRKYSKRRNSSGLTGARAAKRILESQGIYDVKIVEISGELTDHYDPSRHTLSLSESVYGSASVAAVGVAAHECGHAVQHAYGYAPLRIRGALVPIANFGSRVSWILIVLGLIFGGVTSNLLLQAGILVFCAVVLFHIVTLPVEFNASSRALTLLENNGILAHAEIRDTRKVLSAAALTYVASVISVVLQLLRLILIAGRRRN